MIKYFSELEIEKLSDDQQACYDFIVVITGRLIQSFNVQEIAVFLQQAVHLLAPTGLLFVQGTPDILPELGVALERTLKFKYWIAVESARRQPTHGLPSVHAGILMFSKSNRFEINRVRFPHQLCSHCGKTLRDWGGKSHLMNPDGRAISDVWKDLPVEDNYSRLSNSALDVIIKMASGEDGEKSGLIFPQEGMSLDKQAVAEPIIQYYLPFVETQENKTEPQASEIKDEKLWNVVHQGDAVEILRQYPSNSVDLVFADPPYNLDKSYNVYADELDIDQYLSWCTAWLDEYVRILKPTGSLYILNLPRWAMYHANYLNKKMYFQNWIVWDALSEPRGKLMPAHYSLLFYTKHPSDFILNSINDNQIDARQYCLRAGCIRTRKAAGENKKEPLSDIWSDIHRIKHRRDRDYHPCQLPDGLLERIILMSTNEGGIVLDALVGVGTTAIMAAKLNRRYVAIDIDPEYVKITRGKLAEIKSFGKVLRVSAHKQSSEYSKKELQLELRRLTLELGHLPTQEDVLKHGQFGLQPYLDSFTSWGKALKAAKLEIRNGY